MKKIYTAFFYITCLLAIFILVIATQDNFIFPMSSKEISTAFSDLISNLIIIGFFIWNIAKYLSNKKIISLNYLNSIVEFSTMLILAVIPFFVFVGANQNGTGDQYINSALKQRENKIDFNIYDYIENSEFDINQINSKISEHNAYIDKLYDDTQKDMDKGYKIQDNVWSFEYNTNLIISVITITQFIIFIILKILTSKRT